MCENGCISTHVPHVNDVSVCVGVRWCALVCECHRYTGVSLQPFLCGQVVLKPIQMALNHPCFLANSQHKYPRSNTEVTLGFTIFQSSCLRIARLSNGFISLTASRSVKFSLSLPGPISLLLSLTSLHTLLCCLSQFNLPILNFSESLSQSFCFPPSALSCLLFILCYFLLCFTPFLLFSPLSWRHPRVFGKPVALALIQPCLLAICQHLFNLTSAHISLSPSPTCLASCLPLRLPVFHLWPVGASIGPCMRVVSKPALITNAHLA